MKLLVCGSRHFTDSALFARVMETYHDVSEIIEGEAPGADTLARLWAEQRKIPVAKFPARWSDFGRAAGPIRNTQMLAEGRPDKVLAFLAPNSKGTKNMIEQAKRANIPVQIFVVSQ